MLDWRSRLLFPRSVSRLDCNNELRRCTSSAESVCCLFQGEFEHWQRAPILLLTFLFNRFAFFCGHRCHIPMVEEMATGNNLQMNRNICTAYHKFTLKKNTRIRKRKDPVKYAREYLTWRRAIQLFLSDDIHQRTFRHCKSWFELIQFILVMIQLECR